MFAHIFLWNKRNYENKPSFGIKFVLYNLPLLYRMTTKMMRKRMTRTKMTMTMKTTNEICVHNLKYEVSSVEGGFYVFSSRATHGYLCWLNIYLLLLVWYFPATWTSLSCWLLYLNSPLCIVPQMCWLKCYKFHFDRWFGIVVCSSSEAAYYICTKLSLSSYSFLSHSSCCSLRS